MKYVLHILKKKLQSEKHCALVHSKLAHDKRFAASARMAQERIPQLEKAIEILSQQMADEGITLSQRSQQALNNA